MKEMKEKQAKAYIEEAELSLETAEIIFDKAKEEDKDLWANVIKSCYDAIEQAISAAISIKNENIPKEYPAKVKKFINLFTINKKSEEKIYFWLRKRSCSQYVDIKYDKIFCFRYKNLGLKPFFLTVNAGELLLLSNVTNYHTLIETDLKTILNILYGNVSFRKARLDGKVMLYGEKIGYDEALFLEIFNKVAPGIRKRLGLNVH